MALNFEKCSRSVARIDRMGGLTNLAEHIRPRPYGSFEILPAIPHKEPYSKKGQHQRLSFLSQAVNKNFDLFEEGKLNLNTQDLEGNIENYIGMAQVPVGVAGPLMVNGTSAKGQYYIPLATTEGALVASYGRGMKACTMNGGVTSVCISEGVQRCPYFQFHSISEVGLFVQWVIGQRSVFDILVEQRSKHAKLEDISVGIEGNGVILSFQFQTGDAAGQNMVTFCTDALCEFIIENAPVSVKKWYLESNYAGDKKATWKAFQEVRGKKVTAEIRLSRASVEEVLKTTPEHMVDYWRSSTLAALQSGTVGAQGHVANGLTAIFIACGQDVACVSEASVGVTRMELTNSGELYASLTLPNLIVGTVGGGTHLPTQAKCLDMIDCLGEGKAKRFAEICAGVAIAGEISIAAALASGQFAQAHKALGRKTKTDSHDA